MRKIAAVFNLLMLLWLIYESLVVAGLFGPPPSHFPLGHNFGLLLIAAFWGLGNTVWALAELVRALRRRTNTRQ